jgi:hypothetical protein
VIPYRVSQLTVQNDNFPPARTLLAVPHYRRAPFLSPAQVSRNKFFDSESGGLSEYRSVTNHRAWFPG